MLLLGLQDTVLQKMLAARLLIRQGQGKEAEEILEDACRELQGRITERIKEMGVDVREVRHVEVEDDRRR